MAPNLGLTTPSKSILPQIRLSASGSSSVTEWKGDIVVLGASADAIDTDASGNFTNPILKDVDQHLHGALRELLQEVDFKGKPGQSALLRTSSSSNPAFKWIVLVGYSTSSSSSNALSSWRSFGDSVASATKSVKAQSMALTLADFQNQDSEALRLRAHAIAIGIILATHEDSRYKSERTTPTLTKLDFIGFGSECELAQQLGITEIIADAAMFTKELVNSPANVLTPVNFAEEVKLLAGQHPDVFNLQILDEEKCRELKMGAYLGVTAAATNPAQFIHLTYQPPTGTAPVELAILGKGITFDSGGYNLKLAGSSIELMKNDMAGAGAVFGAAKAIAAIRPLGVKVHFIVPACENMISGTGVRPGDILTASNGKTIEVNNTDAEGRLILADALVYASKLGVQKIVDLATLTGACIVALGNDVAGLFSTTEELAKELTDAAERSGEKVWRLPLEEAYWESMKSSVADMLNTGPSAAGAITAALFMKQFVDENIPWAHLDIAGPNFDTTKKLATGYAVNTVVEWVLKHQSS